MGVHLDKSMVEGLSLERWPMGQPHGKVIEGHRLMRNDGRPSDGTTHTREHIYWRVGDSFGHQSNFAQGTQEEGEVHSSKVKPQLER